MQPDKLALARSFFYRPFYETRQGHIVGLATTEEHMRDGLAIVQFGRLFPSYEYPEIVVEPGRRSTQPGENLIVVGRASLLAGSDGGAASAEQHAVGKQARILRLYANCCYMIIDKGKNRFVLNTVTEQRYVPVLPPRDRRDQVEIDYGIIRRWFRGLTENTITGEGSHRVGTIAASKLATSPVFLSRVREAIEKLDGFKDSVPLEILVRGEFHPDGEPIYSLDRIHAVPVAMVYNKQWIYDFQDNVGWSDQLPWNIHVGAMGERLPLPVPSTHPDFVPRLELRADLRGLDAGLRAQCREFLGSGAASGEDLPAPREREVRPWIEALVAESSRFDVEVWESKRGERPSFTTLPIRAGTAAELWKRFLIHLALCRLLGRPLQVSASSIRRCYTEFQRDLKATGPAERERELEKKFIGQVPGKWKDGLAPLLVDAKGKDKNYVERIEKARAYTLKLNRAMLVLKLRV